MISFVLEVIVFQLAFLMVYDLFLKRETFFQWNRGYLLVTFLLSLLLPWIKVEALKTTVSEAVFSYPEFFISLDGVSGGVPPTKEPAFWELLTWYEWLYGVGVLVMGLWLGLKLFRIAQLRKRGSVRYYPQFTKITVPKSEVAFSFFKQVFLGDGVQKEKEPQIVAHELVHIRQWHSLDLVFFELMRILFWCNPLVYVYQSRVTDLHEFIADSHMVKGSKKKQYEALLSQAFQTENISFVNSFFRSSLLRKRLLMLGKEKSKAIFQLKYLLLLPLVLGMLLYSSCEREVTIDRPFVGIEVNATEDDEKLIDKILDEIEMINEDSMLFKEHVELYQLDKRRSKILSKEQYFRKELYFINLLMRFGEKGNLAKKTKEAIENLKFPSTTRYLKYVERKTAFQSLDINLETSIPQEEFSLHKINLLEKYLDDYEVIKVASVKKFTGAEIRALNRTIADNKDKTHLELVLTDGTTAYLVSKKNKVVLDDNLSSSIANTNMTQETVQTQTSVPFSRVDVVPIFPGCENASDKKGCFQEKMKAHIKRYFTYPKEAQESGLQGKVYIVFMVDTDGSITNIRKRGPHPLLENEAVRIIEKLPKMKPGEEDGKAVAVPYAIPITFRLADTGSSDNIESENEVTIIGYGSKKGNNGVPFTVVDQVPIFPGCENALDQKGCFQEKMIAHIKKNFNYPREAQDLGVQGRVSTVFVVDTDGSITNIRKRGPHPLLENEAVRIIEKLPKMIPGEHDGEKVQVPFSIPISFKLRNEEGNATQFSLWKDEKDVDQETKNTIAKYNQLVKERDRLLKAASPKNPVIVNLDDQLEKLRLNILEKMGKSGL